MKDFSGIRLFEMRDEFVSCLEKLLLVPYAWGGDDPAQGFDCSGVINEALQSVGLTEHRSDYTADGLMRRFLGKVIPPAEAKEGCLVFYLKGGEDAGHAVADHVEAFMSHWQVIGAIGGDRPGTTVEEIRTSYPRMADFPRFIVQKWIDEWEAARRGAFVKKRPFGYRPGPFVVIDPFMPAPDEPGE